MTLLDGLTFGIGLALAALIVLAIMVYFGGARLLELWFGR